MTGPSWEPRVFGADGVRDVGDEPRILAALGVLLGLESDPGKEVEHLLDHPLVSVRSRLATLLAEHGPRYAAALLRATPPGDARQWAFSASAVVRALVLAGRDAEALAWARGERMLHGVLASGALVRLASRAEAAPIAGHPETSTARALVRAHGRLGDAASAARLAARVVRSPGARGDHAAWLARLVALEAALWAPIEDRAAALADARAALADAHAAASAHHADLLSAAPADLAAAIDRVFY